MQNNIQQKKMAAKRKGALRPNICTRDRQRDSINKLDENIKDRQRKRDYLFIFWQSRCADRCGIPEELVSKGRDENSWLNTSWRCSVCYQNQNKHAVET